MNRTYCNSTSAVRAPPQAIDFVGDCSPDGLTGMQQLPQFGWHWSDDPTNLRVYRQAHCKTMMPMSATDFLKYAIPVVRPNSTIDRIEPTVDAAPWNANIEQANQNAERMHMQQHQTWRRDARPRLLFPP